jgi:hypothetical protein
MPKTKTTVPTKCQGDGCEKERRNRSRFCPVECYFWSRFDRSAGPDACWPWTGAVSSRTGYGMVDAKTAGGNRTSAHRRAYRLAYGIDPGDMQVMHRCDVRHCGNPRHLTLGTAADNWLDAVLKGRQTVVCPGERNRSAKLTASEVQAIRRSAAPMRDLVRRHGVNYTTVMRIIRGELWRHVPQEEPAEMVAAE